jgi:hypothetical protein
LISSSDPPSETSQEIVMSLSDETEGEGSPMPSVALRHSRLNSDQRKLVTPPKFNRKDGVNLKDFLATFETYFQRKFYGNSYDQTQKLAEFLEGDLLNVYQVRGGHKLKYKAMKQALLNYYKTHKVGGKHYWRRELRKQHLT